MLDNLVSYLKAVVLSLSRICTFTSFFYYKIFPVWLSLVNLFLVWMYRPIAVGRDETLKSVNYANWHGFPKPIHAENRGVAAIKNGMSLLMMRKWGCAPKLQMAHYFMNYNLYLYIQFISPFHCLEWTAGLNLVPQDADIYFNSKIDYSHPIYLFELTRNPRGRSVYYGKLTKVKFQLFKTPFSFCVLARRPRTNSLPKWHRRRSRSVTSTCTFPRSSRSTRIRPTWTPQWSGNPPENHHHRRNRTIRYSTVYSTQMLKVSPRSTVQPAGFSLATTLMTTSSFHRQH